MRIRLPLISFAGILAVCACGGRDPVSNGAGAAATGAPTPSKPVASAAGGPSQAQAPPAAPSANAPVSPANEQATATSPSATMIPAALQGRWGLTPGDCTSTRGDAKGLLVISAAALRFYESRAVPSPGVEVREDSIRGNFRFTGEGQDWTRFERLERNGANLVRTESNPAASYTYAKC